MDAKGPQRIEAPWNAAQVMALNSYQQLGYVHPFTCRDRGDGSHEGESELLATENGWVCSQCPYTQNWAYGFMLYTPPNPMEVLGGR